MATPKDTLTEIGALLLGADFGEKGTDVAYGKWGSIPPSKDVATTGASREVYLKKLQKMVHYAQDCYENEDSDRCSEYLLDLLSIYDVNMSVQNSGEHETYVEGVIRRAIRARDQEHYADMMSLLLGLLERDDSERT